MNPKKMVRHQICQLTWLDQQINQMKFKKAEMELTPKKKILQNALINKKMENLI